MKTLLFKILFFFIILFFSNCNENLKTSIKPKKIDKDLGELVNKYPNYKINKLSEENLITELSNRIDSLITLNYFDDIDFEILRVKKNPHGSGNLIIMHTKTNNSNDTLLSSRINLNLIALLDNDSIALNLKEGYYYNIKGKKINRIDEIQRSLITDEIYYNSTPSINKEYPFYKFNLGTFIIVVDCITES